MRASALAVWVALPAAASASGWSVEAYGGAPLNLHTPLVIEQSGHPDLRLSARYETWPFEAP